MKKQLRILRQVAVIGLLLTAAVTQAANSTTPTAPSPGDSPAGAPNPVPNAVVPTPPPSASPTPTPAPSPTPGPTPLLKPIVPGPALLFMPQDNQITISDQQLDYSMSGSTLRIGTSEVDSDGVSFDIKRNVTASGESYVLKFSWPKNWLDDGLITITTNAEKKKLFSETVDAQKVSDFTTLKSKDTSVSTVGQGNFEKEITLADISNWDVRVPFKFCIEKTEKDFKKSICSKDYILLKTDIELRIKASKDKFKNSASLDGVTLAAKGSTPLKYDTKSMIAFTFENGTVFNLETQPVKADITDVIKSEDQKSLIITAKNGVPVAETEPTSDGSWRMKVDLKKPEFYLYTSNNVQLKQVITLPKAVPSEQNRVVLNKGTPTSTYSNHVLIHGSVNKDWKVSSTEASIDARQGDLFNWNFQAKDKNQVNTSHIKVSKDSEDYTSIYSIYRGYPFELSGRFTASLTGSNTLLLGEVLGSAWAENIFKSENETWSVLRWGASVRYMGTVISSKDSNGVNTTLSSLNGDVKYRFTPGIWNQDKTFGAMLSFQAASFDNTSTSMGGLGLFWVHPMPSTVDKLLNHVRWFRYPKIIDAEVQYYILPVSPGVTLGTNINAIVHSKLFIKPDFFTEFGLGFRQFGYTQTNVYQAQVSVLFATGGVGWNF